MYQFNKLKKKIKDCIISRDYNEALRLCNSALAELERSLYESENLVDLGRINEKIYQKESEFLRMCAALADMANEYEHEARALFEYYNSVKCSPKIIISLINNFDKNVFDLSRALNGFREIEVEKNDGVLYKDFVECANSVGFSEAFTNLMFSSKIIFTKKSDFLEFMKNLDKYGHSDVALSYFEGAEKDLFYDEDFMNLYRKIADKKEKERRLRLVREQCIKDYEARFGKK